MLRGQKKWRYTVGEKNTLDFDVRRRISIGAGSLTLHRTDERMLTVLLHHTSHQRGKACTGRERKIAANC